MPGLPVGLMKTFAVDLVRDREVPRDLEAAGLHFVDRHPHQTRHLAGMRRDDHLASLAAGQPIRIR
jgi:hypothetical protein